MASGVRTEVSVLHLRISSRKRPWPRTLMMRAKTAKRRMTERMVL